MLNSLLLGFGMHIAQIAAQHGLDIEPQLASILPGKVTKEPKTA
jgi:hypothetical protein